MEGGVLVSAGQSLASGGSLAAHEGHGWLIYLAQFGCPDQPFKMIPANLRLAEVFLVQPGTKVGEMCAELGVSRQTLDRHVTPTGEPHADGLSMLAQRSLNG